MQHKHINILILLLLTVPIFAIEFDWKPLMEPGSGGRLTSLIVSPHDSNRILVGGDMLGVGISVDSGDSWDITFGFDSWEMADFSWHPTDPNIVWVGSMSGPYKSEDGGVNWVSKRKGMPAMSGLYTVPIERVLFDPNNSDRLIAVGGSHRRWEANVGSPKWGAVWESLDAGESWKQIGTIQNKNIVAAGFAAGSSDILYAAVDKTGAFISEDGGQTWESISDNLPSSNINWIEPHPTLPNVAYVAMGNHKPSGASQYEAGGIWKTEDYGQTWVAKNSGLAQQGNDNSNNAAKYETVVMSPKNPEVLFTGCTSWTNNNPYISTDGGETWKSTAGSVKKCYPAGKSMECATIDPNNANFILGAGSEYILRTTDGGSSWDDATAFQPEGTSLWRGRGFSGLVCKDFAWDPNDPNHAAFAAMDGGNFWHSRNNLYSWEKAKSPVGNWGGGNALCFAGTSTIFVGLGQYNFEGIGRTTDGGARWTVKLGSSAGLPEKYAGKKVTSVYALQNDSSKVWAAIGGDLYFSENTGDTWSVIFDAADVQQISGSRQNPSHIYLASDKGVYESTDGQDFKLMNGPKNATGVQANPHDEHSVYATSWRETGGLWRYNGSWEKIHNDKYIDDVTIHPSNPDIIAFITNDHPYHDASYATGVYLSEDGGTTWTQQNKGLTVLRGGCIEFNPHNGDQIVVGTGGRGYFVSGDNETSVESATAHQPDAFVVYANYPNPFNPQTTLVYSLNVHDFIEINIYNILGKKVRTLVEADHVPGLHSLIWDGKDESGFSAASGIYLVNYQGTELAKSQKILMVQ
jgi:photosystem II stability/assembly factor-like uncharacterized protein